MKPIPIVAIHGFLGKASLWKGVKQYCDHHLKVDCHWYTPELLSAGHPLNPRSTFDEWPEVFASYLREKGIFEDVVFIGYSLGGRLLSHFLQKLCFQPRAAIFLSSNPLPLCHDDRIQRKIKDEEWTQMFSSSDWPELIKLWDEQKIFHGDTGGGGKKGKRLR